MQEFVEEHVDPDATLYTDETSAYVDLPNHQTVRHSVGEYVQEQAHTNGIESFWALLKRGYYGTYHKMSEKHLARYIGEFTGRHNARAVDTIEQMALMAKGMMGKQLTYQELLRTHNKAAKLDEGLGRLNRSKHCRNMSFVFGLALEQ